MSFSFSKEAIEELKNQIDIVDACRKSVELGVRVEPNL